jgi:hypothetical protein
MTWAELIKEQWAHHNRVMRLVEMMHRDEVPRIFRNDKLIEVVDVIPDLSHYEEQKA